MSAETAKSWREWVCFIFTDNSPQTQALPEYALRALICRNCDERRELALKVDADLLAALRSIAEHECMCCAGDCSCGGRYEDTARAAIAKVGGQ